MLVRRLKSEYIWLFFSFGRACSQERKYDFLGTLKDVKDLLK